MRLDRTKQWTLKRSIAFEGIGLHSGAMVRMTLRPAPEGFGVRFVRSDLLGAPAVPALAEYVVDTRLSTTLGHGMARISTVEHLMAALWMLGVSNLEILVDGPELPILDGSALPYAGGILEVGRREQAARRPRFLFDHRLEVDQGDRSVLFQPSPSRLPEVTYIIDYGHPHVGPQLFEGHLDEERFVREIAPARTFCLLSEVEAMRKAGLAKGGSLDNAVVIGDEGPLNALRFPDECVRHKVLDLIGDLALTGLDWVGAVVAAKAGHPLHVALARDLRVLALSPENSNAILAS